MTELQKHLMQLVKEIDETCRENNLTYALCGQTAGCAIARDKFTTGCYQFHIMMPAGDISLLKAELSKKNLPDRGIEDLSVNEKLAHNRVRYVDTATMVLDREDPMPYCMPGVAVTIFPLFTKPHSKFGEALEVGTVYLNGGKLLNEAKETEYQKKCIKAVRLTRAFPGSRFTAKQIYRLIEKEKGKVPGEVLYIKAEDDKLKAIPSSAVLHTKRICFEGLELPVPEDAESYFQAHFGNNWENIVKEPLPTSNRMDVIWDAEASYKEYFKEFKENDIDIYDIYAQIREYRHWFLNVYRVWKAKSDQTLRFGKRSVDRFEMYVKYKNRMEELEKAAKEKDMEGLKEMLLPYLQCVEKYRKKKMGFFVTTELHRYACMVWKAEKKKGYGKKILNLTPDIYKKMDIEAYLDQYDLQ